MQDVDHADEGLGHYNNKETGVGEPDTKTLWGDHWLVILTNCAIDDRFVKV